MFPTIHTGNPILDFLINQLLSSGVFTLLLTAAGGWILTKFPAVAAALKRFGDANIQAAVERIYEEVKLDWASNGKVVKTADDVHAIIEEVFTIIQKMFPNTSAEKLKGMATAAVASPHTSDVTKTIGITQ